MRRTISSCRRKRRELDVVPLGGKEENKRQGLPPSLSFPLLSIQTSEDEEKDRTWLTRTIAKLVASVETQSHSTVCRRRRMKGIERTRGRVSSSFLPSLLFALNFLATPILPSTPTTVRTEMDRRDAYLSSTGSPGVPLGRVGDLDSAGADGSEGDGRDQGSEHCRVEVGEKRREGVVL